MATSTWFRPVPSQIKISFKFYLHLEAGLVFSLYKMVCVSVAIKEMRHVRSMLSFTSVYVPTVD